MYIKINKEVVKLRIKRVKEIKPIYCAQALQQCDKNGLAHIKWRHLFNSKGGRGGICWLSSDSTAEGTSLTPVLIVPKDFHKALFIQK